MLPKTKTIETLISETNLDYDDFENMHVEYILPRDPKYRNAAEMQIRKNESFYNDLYDEEIEDGIRQSNKNKFDKKLSIAEINKLPLEKQIAYHRFLQDSLAESLT